MPLPRTLKEINFAFGLNTKGDQRAQPEQLLEIATNVEFDDLGGLRCRFPYDAVRTNILGGGTIANARKLAINGDELVLFTIDSVYSWSARDSAWVLKGTHLAVKLDEATSFATNSDQIDSDRAELSGAVIFAWTDTNKVYVAAKDKTTGDVIMAPTAIPGAPGATATRPRLVALGTKIMLAWHNGTDAAPGAIYGLALNPASIATSLAAAATVLVAASAAYYDITRVIGADQAVFAARLAPDYRVGTVTAAMAVATSFKARVCDGPIAVSCDPTGAKVQIVRGNGANIQGDLITISTLADVFTAQAVGTGTVPINQIATAHRSVQNGGQYRCYAFWSSGEDPTNAGGFFTKSNWVDTNNSLGAEANFAPWVGVGSRAFDYAGSVYVWLTFGQTSGLGAGAANTNASGNFQNAYYLHRDDKFMCARAVWLRGGGLCPTTGRLPGVQLVGGSTGFAWCAVVRGVIPVGPGVDNTTTWTAILPGAVNPRVSTYSMRAPQEIEFTFDSNEARRSVRLGRTLYIATGEGVLQYDGVGLYEVGANVVPWYFDAVIAGPGNIPNGLYGYKSTLRFANAQAEVERSTTAAVANATMAGGPLGFAMTTVNVPLTHKTTNVAALEVWRTAVAPVANSPFDLVTSRDPSVTANPNRYLANAPTSGGFSASMRDAYSDTTLRLGQANPENDGVLENLGPPAASVIAATDTRLFLAGVPGDPDRVWYSKQRNDGEIATFHDTLTFSVPPDGGAITRIDILEGGLVVWRETATYLFSNGGFDNTGNGVNYQLARIVSTTLGCVSQESAAYGDDWWLVKTSKGWFVLDKAFTYSYVGEGAFRYDSEPVYAMTVSTARHQIRAQTNGRTLVFDTLVKQWAESSIGDGLDMVIWNGAPAYLAATGVRAELASWDGYAGTDYTLTSFEIEGGFIKFGAMQSRAVVDFVQLLGEFRSDCRIRTRIAKDYEAVYDGTTGTSSWNYTTDEYWNATPPTIGSSLQVRQAPRWKRCESLKVRFTVTHADGVSALAGPCARLTSIVLQFANEPNAYSALGAAQKS